MNAITRSVSQAVAERNPSEQWAVLKHSLYPGAADESVQMVLSYCKARGLDPMLKPVHIVPVWDQKSGGMRDVVMPGIPLYRIQAARTGTYAGKTEPEFGPDLTENLGGQTITFPAWCRVTVRRIIAGQVYEFTAKEYWKENYATKKRDTAAPNAMWAKRPYGQLGKCTEAQALRMAFPEETGGEVTAEEMEGKALGPDSLPPARGPMMDHLPEQPAAPMAWPVLAPDGRLLTAKSPQQWVKWAESAVAKLEDGSALVQWRDAMSEHMDALEAHDAAAVQQVRDAVTDRLDGLASAEDTQDGGAS